MKVGDLNPNALAMAAGIGAALVLAWYVTKGVRKAAAAAGDVADSVKAGASYAGDVVTGREDPLGDLIGFRFGDWWRGVTAPDAVGFELKGRPADAPPVSDAPVTFEQGTKGYQYGGMWGL